MPSHYNVEFMWLIKCLKPGMVNSSLKPASTLRNIMARGLEMSVVSSLLNIISFTCLAIQFSPSMEVGLR